MSAPLLQFRVVGLPRTAGSLRPMMTRNKDATKRKAVLIPQNNQAHEKWRALVVAEATRARGKARLATIDGPVKLVLMFALHRGDSRYSRPVAKNLGDVSKLVRAVEDALTEAKVWVDDRLVTYLLAVKDFPGQRVGQSTPGVLVRIWPDDPNPPGQGSLLSQEVSP